MQGARPVIARLRLLGLRPCRHVPLPAVVVHPRPDVGEGTEGGAQDERVCGRKQGGGGAGHRDEGRVSASTYNRRRKIKKITETKEVY